MLGPLAQELEPVLGLPARVAQPLDLLAGRVGIVRDLAAKPGDDDLARRQRGRAVHAVQVAVHDLDAVRLAQVGGDRSVVRARDPEDGTAGGGERAEDGPLAARRVAAGAEVAHDGDRLGVVALGRLDHGGDRSGGSAGVGGADQARQACHGAGAGW